MVLNFTISSLGANSAHSSSSSTMSEEAAPIAIQGAQDQAAIPEATEHEAEAQAYWIEMQQNKAEYQQAFLQIQQRSTSQEFEMMHLNTQLAEAIRARQESETERDQTKAECAELRKKLSEEETDVRLQSALTHRKQVECLELEEKITGFKSEYQSNQATIKSLHLSASETSSMNRSLERKIEGMKTAEAALAAQKLGLETEVAEYSGELQEMMVAARKHSEKMAGDCKSEIAKRDDVITTLRDELKEAEKKLSSPLIPVPKETSAAASIFGGAFDKWTTSGQKSSTFSSFLSSLDEISKDLIPQSSPLLSGSAKGEGARPEFGAFGSMDTGLKGFGSAGSEEIGMPKRPEVTFGEPRGRAIFPREASPDRMSSAGSIFGSLSTSAGRSRSQDPVGSSIRSSSFSGGRMAGVAPAFSGRRPHDERAPSFGKLPMNLVNTTAALACYMTMKGYMEEKHITVISRKVCIEQVANALKIGPDNTVAIDVFGQNFVEALATGVLDGRESAGTYNRTMKTMLTHLGHGKGNEKAYLQVAHHMIEREEDIANVLAGVQVLLLVMLGWLILLRVIYVLARRPQGCLMGVWQCLLRRVVCYPMLLGMNEHGCLREVQFVEGVCWRSAQCYPLSLVNQAVCERDV